MIKYPERHGQNSMDVHPLASAFQREVIEANPVEAFDATFPPKERKWMPSREEFYIYSHSSVTR